MNVLVVENWSGGYLLDFEVDLRKPHSVLATYPREIRLQRTDWGAFEPIMKTPLERERGMVAILDALGASRFTATKISRFLRSRQLVLQLLDEKAEVILGGVRKDMVSTFTFNDTIVIALKLDRMPNLNDIRAFFTLLRKFMIDSLVNKILFRGAISIGSFYVDEGANTVMGKAVTDAAAWYDRADWMGVHATPRATIIIDQLLESEQDKAVHVITGYAVPMKQGSSPTLYTVNWPKAFFVSNLRPCTNEEPARSKLLSLLGVNRIPTGAEVKFLNSITFFDFIVKSQGLQKKIVKRSI